MVVETSNRVSARLQEVESLMFRKNDLIGSFTSDRNGCSGERALR